MTKKKKKKNVGGSVANEEYSKNTKLFNVCCLYASIALPIIYISDMYISVSMLPSAAVVRYSNHNVYISFFYISAHAKSF